MGTRIRRRVVVGILAGLALAVVAGLALSVRLAIESESAPGDARGPEAPAAPVYVDGESSVVVVGPCVGSDCVGVMQRAYGTFRLADAASGWLDASWTPGAGSEEVVVSVGEASVRGPPPLRLEASLEAGEHAVRVWPVPPGGAVDVRIRWSGAFS